MSEQTNSEKKGLLVVSCIVVFFIGLIFGMMIPDDQPIQQNQTIEECSFATPNLQFAGTCSLAKEVLDCEAQKIIIQEQCTQSLKDLVAKNANN